MPAAADDRKVLILEDEWLLADQLAGTLTDAGFAVVEPVPSVAAALQALQDEALGAAVLDISLGREDSFPVARELARRGVPFVFVTGYTHADLPEDLRERPVLKKPVHPADLIARLRSLVGGGK
jgi:DNA-binding response OmpR family regulator